MFRNCNSCSNNTEQNQDLVFENDNIPIYNNNIQSCNCGFNTNSVFPQNWMYAHSYVVNQRLNQIYTPEMGLKMGTIFPELVSPYCPNQSSEEISFLRSSNTGGGCNSCTRM